MTDLRIKLFGITVLSIELGGITKFVTDQPAPEPPAVKKRRRPEGEDASLQPRYSEAGQLIAYNCYYCGEELVELTKPLSGVDMDFLVANHECDDPA